MQTGFFSVTNVVSAVFVRFSDETSFHSFHNLTWEELKSVPPHGKVVNKDDPLPPYSLDIKKDP